MTKNVEECDIDIQSQSGQDKKASKTKIEKGLNTHNLGNY